MPYMYEQKGPSLLSRSEGSLNYNSEYASRYGARRDFMKATRIPTAHQTHKYFVSRPDTCQLINPPRTEPLRPSYIGRHIPTSQSIKRYRESLVHQRASSAPWMMHRPGTTPGTYPGPHPAQCEATTSAYTRPGDTRVQPLFIRRPKSELSVYPKTFPIVNRQCYFHPAQESGRRYYVVDRHWLSERQQLVIQKNNVFA